MNKFKIILSLSLLASLFISSCKKDELSTVKVGDQYGGGTVGYLLKVGDVGYDSNVKHGIIIQNGDLTNTGSLGCQTASFRGQLKTTIGSGQTNTTLYVKNCTEANIAAKLCDNLVVGESSDWFLPSREEIEIILFNGILPGQRYLNSSGGLSYIANGVTGQTDAYNPSGIHKVRAFRYF
jgi:hypothetical protein